MKLIKTVLALAWILSAPVACASMAEGNFMEADAERLCMRLERGEGFAGAGYAASLLREGLWDQSGGVRNTRSPLVEGVASFLLPGLGQHRMGRTLRSKIFFGLEGASWVAIGSFLWQGYARENAYKEYAVAYAGVSGTSHSGEYYETIGDYRSNDGPGGYNEAVRREARDLYYPDVAAIEEYYETNKIEGELGWRWPSKRVFDRYNALRDGSSASYRRALYTVFFAMALRVVSTVDAVRLARGEASVAEGEGAGRAVSMSVEHQPGGLIVSINRSF